MYIREAHGNVRAVGLSCFAVDVTLMLEADGADCRWYGALVAGTLDAVEKWCGLGDFPCARIHRM